MNPEQLLQNFDRLIDTPDAVPRLRRFILDLAVRGKLVEQNPEDEPAAELLKRIEAEKRRLEKLRHIKKAKEFGNLSAVEVPFNIPDIWKWTPFSKLVDFAAGRTPSRHDTSFWNTGDYHWVSIADMTDGKLITSTKETVSEKAKTTVFKNSPSPAGTIVMSFKLTIGKVSRLSIPAFHNEAIISIYPHLSELDAYLFQFLPLFSQSGTKKNALKGATLNRESLSNLLVPLPPLAEQHRIVAKVDELMKLCDELEAAQAKRERRRDRLVAATLHGLNNGSPESEARELLPFKDSARFYFNHLPRLTTRPEHIQQLRQTILNLAVRGKLVEQNPEDEPVSKVESLDVPFVLASSWRWKSIGDLGRTQTGSTPPTAERRHYNGNIPFIKPAAISYGVINYEGQGLTESGVRESTVVQAGAILMVCIGGSIGKAALVDRPVCFNQQINSVSPNEGIDSHYVLVAMQSPYFYARVVDTAAQGTLPIISKGKWERLLIPLPPLAEQHRIVKKVDDLMALCDDMEGRINSNMTTSRKLLEATLQEAVS